jgi:hypothetical protein
MIKLFYKLLLALVPVFLLALFIVIVDMYSDHVFNPAIDNKIRILTKHVNPDIIIAGDSRAERQVIPKLINSRFNMKSINIATSNGDITTTYYALKKHDLLDKPITVIISASFYQINDSAIDRGYISMAEVINMSVLDKYMIFKAHPSELYSLYASGFMSMLQKKAINSLTEKSLLNDLGFLAVTGNLKLPINYSVDPMTTSHAWYKNMSIRGVRWRIYRETLKMMGSSKCNFIIYQPPVSDAFRSKVRNSEIEKYEKEYSRMIIDEVGKYNNIKVLDYFSQNPPVLSNVDYYDPQHLNKTGAEKFTIYLMQDCIKITGSQILRSM